nr:thioredoxin family protein [uncultured Helcococcus sp.]
MLSSDLKNQLAQYLELLENKLILRVSLDDSDNSKEMKEFLEEVVSLSDKLTLEEGNLELSPSFSLDREDGPSGVVFAGVPMGHEFESFVLALLQVGGRQPKIDQKLIDKIKKIDQDLHFETFVSLTCHNCPEVVQALNIMAVLNPKISNTMIEGGTFQSLVEEKSIMAVPTVYLNGQEIFGGKRSIEEILDMILGEDSRESLADKGVYDTLVIGGGPAAMSAAIYSVRKGIRTGLLADKFGGQVNDTLEINNILGI